jgi:hypothetical protein
MLISQGGNTQGQGTKRTDAQPPPPKRASERVGGWRRGTHQPHRYLFNKSGGADKSRRGGLSRHFYLL